MNSIGQWVLGVLISAFFTLLWRRLDMLEKNMDARFTRIEERLQKLGDAVMEVKGRMDEISKHV